MTNEGKNFCAESPPPKAQEPVAYRAKYSDETRWTLTNGKPPNYPDIIVEPLFTAPPANPRPNVNALTCRLLDVLDNEEELSDELLEAFKALDNAVSAAPNSRLPQASDALTKQVADFLLERDQQTTQDERDDAERTTSAFLISEMVRRAMESGEPQPIDWSPPANLQASGVDISRLPIGTPVEKVGGYPFPGTVVAAFHTLEGNERFVVEATGEAYQGMLHIFNGGQLRATTAAEDGR